jgi:hypothetical protein
VQEFKKTNNKQSLKVIVTGGNDDKDVEYLPEVIDIQGQFMKIRTRPSVLRYKKYREDTEPHMFIYSELLLYHAWKIEEDLSPNDFDTCLALYTEKRGIIEKRPFSSQKTMVEQGRAFIDSVGDVHASHIGYDLDPEHEQMQGNDKETAMEVDANDILIRK